MSDDENHNYSPSAENHVIVSSKYSWTSKEIRVPQWKDVTVNYDQAKANLSTGFELSTEDTYIALG